MTPAVLVKTLVTATGRDKVKLLVTASVHLETATSWNAFKSSNYTFKSTLESMQWIQSQRQNWQGFPTSSLSSYKSSPLLCKPSLYKAWLTERVILWSIFHPKCNSKTKMEFWQIFLHFLGLPARKPVCFFEVFWAQTPKVLSARDRS